MKNTRMLMALAACAVAIAIATQVSQQQPQRRIQPEDSLHSAGPIMPHSIGETELAGVGDRESNVAPIRTQPSKAQTPSTGLPLHHPLASLKNITTPEALQIRAEYAARKQRLAKTLSDLKSHKAGYIFFNNGVIQGIEDLAAGRARTPPSATTTPK